MDNLQYIGAGGVDNSMMRVRATLPTYRQSGVYIVANRGKREIAKVI